MQINQIRYFLALCEERTFTRAAQRCGVSQPTLTTAIRRLEEDLGERLFHRGSRETMLSPFGAAMRPCLLQLEQSAANVKGEAERFLAARSINPINIRENSMRKPIYSVAAVSALFLVAVLITLGVRQPRLATVSAQTQATNTLDVRALESAIDVKALPRQEIPSEADE
jgi:DNA-binding transcriptional LysR family regulator